MIKYKIMKMWAVKGRNHGLKGLFYSKWKAKEALNTLWDLNNGYLKLVDVKKINETCFELRDFKFIKKKPKK